MRLPLMQDQRRLFGQSRCDGRSGRSTVSALVIDAMLSKLIGRPRPADSGSFPQHDLSPVQYRRTASFR